MDSQPISFWRKQLEPVLQSKAEEFELYGYDEVTVSEIWECMLKKKWRKQNIADKMVHELVADVYSLKIGEFMSFMTVEAYKGPELAAGTEGLSLKGL
ncbi:post-transcriptional regulator [Bacillus marinisedimentorum]|uniref:post-transcriptional regulator n=1 Tax=Bacillus marinisedimentorum TaxID=1821260 RepID=UPI000872405B|nr:post-transcriptional regulator [Bacillus marinisedimentorum]